MSTSHMVFQQIRHNLSRCCYVRKNISSRAVRNNWDIQEMPWSWLVSLWCCCKQSTNERNLVHDTYCGVESVCAPCSQSLWGQLLRGRKELGNEVFRRWSQSAALKKKRNDSVQPGAGGARPTRSEHLDSFLPRAADRRRERQRWGFTPGDGYGCSLPPSHVSSSSSTARTATSRGTPLHTSNPCSNAHIYTLQDSHRIVNSSLVC